MLWNKASFVDSEYDLLMLGIKYYFVLPSAFRAINENTLSVDT